MTLAQLLMAVTAALVPNVAEAPSPPEPEPQPVVAPPPTTTTPVEEATPQPTPQQAPPPQSNKAIIREVFGAHGSAAIAVAHCESRFKTTARNGQYRGLMQLGAAERAKYGHGETAREQAEAAHRLFLDRGWQPWKACRK